MTALAQAAAAAARELELEYAREEQREIELTETPTVPAQSKPSLTRRPSIPARSTPTPTVFFCDHMRSVVQTDEGRKHVHERTSVDAVLDDAQVECAAIVEDFLTLRALVGDRRSLQRSVSTIMPCAFPR